MEPCIHEDRFKKQEEALSQINMWLAGNHEPENGMIYKMIDTIKSVDMIKSDISEIKGSVNKAIQDSENTQQLLLKYKSDEEQFEKGKQAIVELQDIKEKNKRDDIKFAIQIITVIVVLFGAYLGAKEFYDKLTKQYDNLGTPVVVTSRGEIGRLPKGDSIKYYRNGEFVNFDTIKK
jgi:hypothetical protein